MLHTRLGLVVCVAAILSAGAGQVPQQEAWSIDQAPSELRPAISRADVIIASVQNALIAELTDALQRGGPMKAISACHLDAIALTQRVGREEGLAVGRTSDRLRSPTNAPRDWAAAIVKEYSGRRASDVAGFAVDLGSRVGVMRPIAQRPMCMGCHGPADRLSPGVRSVLEDRYPADRAVGFREGEIRGWYWVEVPKTRGEPGWE